jgi:hypothetical protein
MKTKTKWPKYPPDQEGKRLTPDELRRVVEEKDHSKLSQEGQYAVEKLAWLHKPEQVMRPDRADREASLSATVSLTIDYLREDIVRGRKVKADAGKRKKATLEQLQAQYARMQQCADKLCNSHPDWSYREIARKVAKEFGRSERTVRRNIQNPQKRRDTTR